MAVIIAIVTASATTNIENSFRNVCLLICRWKYAQRHVNSTYRHVYVESHFIERNFNYKFNRASHNLCKHFFLSQLLLLRTGTHTINHTCLNTFVYEITYAQKMLILSHIPPILLCSSFEFHVFTSYVYATKPHAYEWIK